MEGSNPVEGNLQTPVVQGAEQNGLQNTEGAPQKTSMFYYDPNFSQYVMDPTYVQFFNQKLEIIQVLGQTINQKWTEQQMNAYLKILNELQYYIMYYALNNQIAYIEDYVYGEQYYIQANPLGAELYQKQLKYLQWRQKQQGTDKKIKDPNASKLEQKNKPAREVEEKEKVIVRSGDPQINLQKLANQNWDQTKYISSSLLAKENANIVFIGHVDSGKSTLTGNIIKELKEVDEQELARNKQELKQNKMEAWEDAAISDIIPEERVDGKTREYAKLNFSLQNKRFTLFDAPGHKNYVPNMIMGACQADIAVLIISAKEGEFQSGFEKEGQTKEHAMLAKALGVIELIAVVTKMGTVNWNEKRFKLIKDQVSPFLENSCGFHNVQFIPIESVQNVNIHKRIENSWYQGPAFLQYLDKVKLPERKPMGPLRIPIIDKFKDLGNLYVYGKIQSGTIIEDQTVTVLPQRLQMVIRQIFNAKDERLPYAYAGDNVKIRVKNVEQDDIGRGDMICNNLNYCQQSAEFKAHVTILQLPEEKKLVSSGYECVIHMHAIASEIQISKIEARIDKETGKKIATGFLKAGEKGVCQIKVIRPICLEKYDFMPSLGRFTLRDQGKTIGYGEIIGLKPAKTLLKQQKEQLIGANESKAVEEATKAVQKVTLNEKKP